MDAFLGVCILPQTWTYMWYLSSVTMLFLIFHTQGVYVHIPDLDFYHSMPLHYWLVDG